MRLITVVFVISSVFNITWRVVCAYYAEKMLKGIREFDQHPDIVVHLSEVYEDILKPSCLLTIVELIVAGASMISFSISIIRFETKISGLFAAIAFILSSTWMFFAYLFLFGSPELNSQLDAMYASLDDINTTSDKYDSIALVLLVSSWHMAFLSRKYLFFCALPLQLLHLKIFQKFTQIKKDQLESRKLVEMRQIYDQLEDSQL